MSMSALSLVKENEKCCLQFWGLWDTSTYQNCSVSVTDHETGRMNPTMPSFARSHEPGTDEVGRWWKVLISVGIQALSSTWCHMLTSKDAARRGCWLRCHRYFWQERGVNARRVKV